MVKLHVTFIVISVSALSQLEMFMSAYCVLRPLEGNEDTVLRAAILCNSRSCHVPRAVVYMNGALWSCAVKEYEALGRDPGIPYERLQPSREQIHKQTLNDSHVKWEWVPTVTAQKKEHLTFLRMN